MNARATILKEIHDISGHGTAFTMIFLMRDKYRWPGMFVDIKNFVRKCKICELGGNEQVCTENRIIVSHDEKDLWEIDLIGVIKGSDSRNKYIFSAVNHFTKWVEAKVILDKSSGTIIKCVQDLIVKKHGAPKRILSDNGCEFKNSDQVKLATRYNIKWIHCSPRHHKTVGCIERTNRTIWTKLRKISEFGRIPWETCIPKTVVAINISPNRPTGTSPYRWVNKKQETTKTDKKYNIQGKKLNKSILMMRRNKIKENYEKEIVKGKRKLKYGLGIGDDVFIYKERLSNKLKERWKGGFKVKGHIPPDAYIVTDGKREMRLNKQHVKEDFSKLGKKVL